MYIALDKLGNEIEATHAKKDEKYFCPVCNSEMQLKRGNIKKSHFSHINIKMCERHLYRRESNLHLKLKHDLYLKLGQIYPVKMECYLEKIEQIPDLLIDEQYALEIQLSKVAPRIILERTKGYFEEQIKVIWLHDDHTLNIKNGILFLTQFHYSTLKHFCLYSIDTHLNIYRYQLVDNIYQNKWTYKRELLSYNHLFSFIPNHIDIKKRLSIDIETEIKQARNERNYLNQTLTYLYKLSIDEKKLPNFLTYLTPSERYINNNPLDWKLYLYYAIETKSYNFNDFYKYLNFRPIFKVEQKRIAEDLLKEFKQIFRKTN